MDSWPHIITEIMVAGYSEAQIAERTETTQPTINRLKRGKQSTVRYEVGAAIKKLHADTRRKRRRA